MHIEGYYLNGKTSKRVHARMEGLQPAVQSFGHAENEQRIIKIKYANDNALPELIELKFSDLKIESRLGNTPREMSFGQDQLFITEDNDTVDQLVKSYSDSTSTSFLHTLETNLTLILFATLITIGASWLIVVYGIPKSAEAIAYQLPDFATEKLSSSLTLLDETIFDPSELTELRIQEIRELTQPYLEHYAGLKPQLKFRSGMQANAFALPGGDIILTDDFVNLAENNEELLAVLFHELGHLNYKHMTRRALQDSMITLLVVFITGDIDSFDLLTGLPTLILDLSYSREFERESDNFALDQMHRFDIPLDHFATIMQRLDQYDPEESGDTQLSLADEQEVSEQESSFSNFLSTHPSTTDRVQLVEQFKARLETINRNHQ